jgi:hypothetical protein
MYASDPDRIHAIKTSIVMIEELFWVVPLSATAFVASWKRSLWFAVITNLFTTLEE